MYRLQDKVSRKMAMKECVGCIKKLVEGGKDCADCRNKLPMLFSLSGLLRPGPARASAQAPHLAMQFFD